MTPEYVIFTDLDGTLLDHHSYSFRPALPALKKLKEFQIPVVLVSSKTYPEISNYQGEMGLEAYPFVVENGSAIYTPPEYFKDFGHFTLVDDRCEFNLGRSYSELVDILKEISIKYHYTIKGFHNSEEREIISRTGLGPEQVKIARTRKFSVPVFYDMRSKNILSEELEKYNLHLLFGGRFMHVLGQVDKGTALKKIMRGYRLKYPSRRFRSLALGDSLNDFAMLRSADNAILVKKHDGTHETREVIPDVIYSPGIGPAGWNDSVLNFIENRGNYE